MTWDMREDLFNSMAAVDAATPAENAFVELFAETFGLDRVQYLINEYPLELRPHQAETLYCLQELREGYNTMALVADAQGTGKTTTAVLDAKRMGLKTLFVAHTVELLKQAQQKFQELWPEAKVEIVILNLLLPTGIPHSHHLKKI